MKYKTATVESGYYKDLQSGIKDISKTFERNNRVRASLNEKPLKVFTAKIGSEIPTALNQFAAIGYEKRRNEWHIILNYYYKV